jgi:hypothetical protein
MSVRSEAIAAVAVLSAVALVMALFATDQPSWASEGGTRVARSFPFAVDAPVNTAVGSGAIFESATDTSTKVFLEGSPELNSRTWSVSVVEASADDPLAEIVHPTTGEIQTTARIPAGAATSPPSKAEGGDSWFAAIQPDGRTVVECYGMMRVNGSRWKSRYVVSNDLHGSGIEGGTRASGTSLLMGLIRQADIDRGEISHALTLSIPNSMLRPGFVWPARNQDNDADESYSGPIPMGSMFAIPSGIDVGALGLDADGIMLAKALQNYGAYVLARSNTNALYAELAADPQRVANLQAAWRNVLFGLMRRVTNSSAENVAGGGVRRQPPLDGLAE